jgi:hypothetical protein
MGPGGGLSMGAGGGASIGNSVHDRVVVFEFEQWSQFFLIEFVNADVHIVRQNEVEKLLLLRAELCADRLLSV